MNLYQKICDRIFLPISDKLLGLKVYARLEYINAFQWKSRKDIDKYRLAKLLECLTVAAQEVPFYRAYFRENKLSLESFKSVEDLSKLPIITKDHIQRHFNMLQREGFSGKTFKMKSSGSTGKQTVVLVDNAVNSDVFSTQLLFWSWGGFYMGAPHLQTGMSLKRGLLKAIKDSIFLCSYTSAFALTDADLHKIVQKLQAGRIKYLFGYASSIFVIASYVQRQKSNIALNKIFTWGDCLFPRYRELIEAVFSCKVIDCYGLGEGLQVACQCEYASALHIAEHNLIVEILDGTGKSIHESDKLGRVVVTRFEPGPMPLIRYETGDLASFVSGTCECGRKLSLLSRVQGRDTDVIQSPKGDRLIVHFFTQIFEMIPEIIQFQIRQEKLDAIKIFYIPDRTFHKGVLDRIASEIHNKCNFKLAIEFVEVQSIPLEKSNKRRFVISSIPYQ